MTFARQLTIPPEHPSLAGHFPGNPVVPGVVILDQVERTLAAWQPGLRIVALGNVKFVGVLRPGEVFTVELDDTGEGRFRFKCTGGPGLLAQGQFKAAAGAVE